MRSLMPALALVATIALSCGGSTETPFGDPPARGESACSETLRGAVFCRESAPGKSVVKGVLSGTGLPTVTFSDRFDALEEREHALRVVTRTVTSDRFPLGVFDGRFCFTNLGAVRCAPVGGGDSTVWLQGVSSVQPLPDGSYLAVTHDRSSSLLSRVDRDGAPIGGVLLESDRNIEWVRAVGDRILVAARSFDFQQQDTLLLSIPLAGGAPKTLLTMTGSSLFFVVKGAVIAPSRDAKRVDLATGAVESLPSDGAYFPAIWQVGDTLVAADAHSLAVLDDQLRPTRPLWTLPDGPDRHDYGVAVMDRAMYLSVERSPCRTVGMGKQSYESCDRTRGRWQIVRVDVP